MANDTELCVSGDEETWDDLSLHPKFKTITKKHRRVLALTGLITLIIPILFWSFRYSPSSIEMQTQVVSIPAIAPVKVNVARKKKDFFQKLNDDAVLGGKIRN